ncbi:hypothetical protein PhaeoP71_00312 [Phaeobacter piscinae]|nr:hypothetical protein PhaeoP71_00312 [Phaeobacter piscinae]
MIYIPYVKKTRSCCSHNAAPHRSVASSFAEPIRKGKTDRRPDRSQPTDIDTRDAVAPQTGLILDSTRKVIRPKGGKGW